MYIKRLLLYPFCCFAMLSYAQSVSKQMPVIQIESVKHGSDMAVLKDIPYYISSWSKDRVNVDDERLLRFFDIPVDDLQFQLDDFRKISEIKLVFFLGDNEKVMNAMNEKFGKENDLTDDYRYSSDEEVHVWTKENVTYVYHNTPDYKSSMEIEFEKEGGIEYEY